MPRVGKLDLPVVAVDDAVARLRKIREVAGSRNISREVAADAMGMSPKGGQTQYIFSTMAGYGLVDTGSKEIRTTDLGEAAVFGDSNEALAAKVQAVQNVTLLREIFSKFGSAPTEEQVRAFLRQEAQVELSKVPNFLDKVTKLLRQMSQYSGVAVQGSPRQGGGTFGAQSLRSDDTARGVTENTIEVRIGSYSFSLPLDDLDLAGRLAKTNIDGIIASLKARRQSNAGDTAAGAETG